MSSSWLLSDAEEWRGEGGLQGPTRSLFPKALRVSQRPGEPEEPCEVPTPPLYLTESR